MVEQQKRKFAFGIQFKDMNKDVKILNTPGI